MLAPRGFPRGATASIRVAGVPSGEPFESSPLRRLRVASARVLTFARVKSLRRRSPKAMSSHVRLAALAFLLPAAFGTAACGASAQARKADSFATDAPDWVTRTPEMDGKVCAVGISGPTRIPENAKNYAAENARAELSNVLGTRVYSMMLDQQTR